MTGKLYMKILNANKKQLLKFRDDTKLMKDREVASLVTMSLEQYGVYKHVEQQTDAYVEPAQLNAAQHNWDTEYDPVEEEYNKRTAR